MADLDRGFADPRPSPSDNATAVDSGGVLRPAVAGGGNTGGVWLVSGGAVLMGLLVFLWLSAHRAPAPTADGAITSGASAPIASPPPAPPDVVAAEAASRGVSPAAAAPALAGTPAPIILAPSPVPATVDSSATTRSPTLVVDLADSEGAGVSGAVGASTTGKGAAGDHGANAATAGSPASNALNGDEQFAARVEGGEPDHASATVLHNRSQVVAQGAMIPAVLETALDSDLPGFARAVVTRDVRSFDGASVLIPRGSRVVGEYRNAASLGQSRAFVIWTRILRPDGVSIQIGSPATDPLGRAGLSGSVDQHFLERFGGAILMSVVTAGAAAIGGTPSTEVVVGSSQDATGLASTASAFTPTNIAPTIKVPQGTPIRIFVARDLDFSPVQGR